MLLHNVRFFSFPPTSITCLSLHPLAHQLALSRADNTIELWDVSDAGPDSGPGPSCRLRQWLPGTSESSVEALCWSASGRLFSTGLHGLVLEHSLEAGLATRHQFAVTSGPAWCMAYHAGRDTLAVGTEQGYVCLFRVTPDGLSYEKVLDKQEGRVLCLQWHSQGGHIVTGSPDTIRVWNVDSGHPMVRMTTGRNEKQRETIVWSVAIADDFTVCSGDSRGKTSFWNGQMGTLIDSYQTHKADVLTVCMNHEQSVIYVSGIDPLVMQFQPITRKDGKKKWVKSVHRNLHTHDVRSIVCGPGPRGAVFSGGVDAVLAASNAAGRKVVKHAPFPHGECVVLAGEANAVVLRYAKYLEMWRLGSAEKPAKLAAGSVLPLQTVPVKLLQLHTRDDETIRCCHVSPDARWVAYATCTRLRVHSIEFHGEETDDEDNPPDIRRLGLKSKDEVQLAHHMKFYRDEDDDEADGPQQRLVTATEKGDLQFFAVDTANTRLVETVKGGSLGLNGGLSHLLVDANSSFLVLADQVGNVVSYRLKTKQLLARMPSYNRAPLVCMSLSGAGDKDNLIMVHADHRVLECHARNGRYTAFSNSVKMPVEWLKKRHVTRGVVQVDKEDKIILYDDLNICSLTRKAAVQQQPAARTPSKKVQRKNKGGHEDDDDAADKKPMTRAKFTKKYENLLFLDALKDGSLVAVEVKPQSLEEQLPPGLRQKKFAAM